MLSGYNLDIRAYAPDNTGLELRCRRCAVQKLGEPAVARLEAGLSTGTGWQIERRWAVDELARQAGYDTPDACGQTPCGRDTDGCCAICAAVFCEECGTRLNAPEQSVAHVAKDQP